MKQKFALVISRIFDPIVVFSATTFIAAIGSGLRGAPLWYFLTAFVLLCIAPPAALLLWAVKSKRVSDWDISRREQRVRVLFVFGFFLIVDYFFVKAFGNSSLETLFVLYIFWFLGFFAITLFWKISGHIAGLTLAVGLLAGRYGSIALPLILFILLVAWARVTTKNHSVSQVVAGFLYSSLYIVTMRVLGVT